MKNGQVYNTINQRNVYKFLEKLTSGSFKNETLLLKSLVRDVVDNEEFEIIGGRVWELQPDDGTYKLRYQYGSVKRIPKDYIISISEQPILSKLIQQRTVLNTETDSLLQKKGILTYSVTGVGEIMRTRNGKFYKFILGFNAPAILQYFFETLSIISSVATVALRNLNAQAEQRKIHKDIFKASEIQRNLLPEHRLRFQDYNIFGVCIPDSGVGGDYFDYIRNSDKEDERLGIVISDAASKGLPAAIQALFVSGAIRMGMGFDTKISQLFSRLNTLIWDTFLYERFVTMFYCELTLSSNRLVLYANAGHCSPMHYRPEIDQFKMLSPTGGLLGIMQYQKFGIENLRMHPGDVLLLYTDGITEAQDRDGKFYGEDRLRKLIRKYHRESPEVIAYNIIEDVQKFTVGSNYSDDRTLVVIRRDSEEDNVKM
jgi:sigma-B regulation protein RsbU (phosphoserine phosphatase)